MEWIQPVLDFIINIDDYLVLLIQNYGPWVYLILFLIIFAETGFVVTPFLPGDSLLFAAGTICALGLLNPYLLSLLLIIAAILGDSVNYATGSYFGLRLFKEDSRIFKLKYLDQTGEFFKNYGGKTIIIARFIPIVRTYAPFVAGASKMDYPRFIFYNILGGIIWVVSLISAGYFFGNLPFVKENFSWVIIGIIILSNIPILIQIFTKKRNT